MNLYKQLIIIIIIKHLANQLNWWIRYRMNEAYMASASI